MIPIAVRRAAASVIAAAGISKTSLSSSSSSVRKMGSSGQMSKEKFGVDSKYKGLETNIWIETNALKDEVGTCVNLGQGFPDYQPAPHIVEYLAAVCKPDPSLYTFHQYARAYGHPRLVQALAALYSPLVGQPIDPWNEVLVTPGAYGSLFYAIMANVGKGDEVIIIEPFFDCYEPMVILAGGKPVFIPLEQKGTCANDWKLNMDKLGSLFNSKTKVLILNTPNNPLGKVFSKKELEQIAELCIKHDVMVISDEVYEWIVHEDAEHIRIASLPGMWEGTVTIGSAGKTFSLTGWKLGWTYGPKHLIRNLQIANQNCTYMCQTPEQEAVAVALEKEVELMGKDGKICHPDSFLYQMRTELGKKREVLLRIVREAGLEPVVPNGGYFIVTDWSGWKSKIPADELDKAGRNLSPVFSDCEDVRFVIWLAKNKRVVVVPTSAFYSVPNKHLAEKLIRFNFSRSRIRWRRGKSYSKASVIIN